jgi:HK97 family phage prohead protease
MIERRTYEQIEIRADKGDDGTLRLIGHAAVFNKKSEEIFGFREIVLPGAFKKSIKKDDIRALWNHDPAHVLGRNKAGTLRLREDDEGLRTEIDLPDTQMARDLHTSVKRGDIDQMSFGFRTISDAWRKEDGITIRELNYSTCRR